MRTTATAAWNRTAAVIALAAAATAAGCATKGGAAAEPAASPAAAERTYTPEEEMAAWMAVAQPGPEHARLASEAGTWDVAVKMWESPGAPPQESRSVARISMILDGHYQQMEYEGSMTGMPFRGMGITGYDNYLKKYVGTWCDTMGTMIMTLEGTLDPASGVLTMRSSWLDPFGRTMTSRHVTSHAGPDRMHWEMYCTMPGKPECKMMEMDYTRRR